MSAILLIFVVSFALVSGDVTGDRQLLDRVEVLERKLSTLTDAYEMLLEVRHVKNDCNVVIWKKIFVTLASSLLRIGTIFWSIVT